MDAQKSEAIHLLLLEDDLEDKLIFERFLSKVQFEQYVLHHVETVEKAIEILGNEPIEVIFIDFLLGACNGFEAIDALAPFAGGKAHVLLTGQGSRGLDIEAMERGVDDYVEKSDLSPNVLERVIRHAISHKKAEAELRQYAYMVSHDLKSPVLAIQSILDFLEGETADKIDESEQMLMREARDSAARMASMIDNLLLYSRSESHRMLRKPVDLNEVVKIVLWNLQEDIRKIEGAVDCRDLPTVEGDRLQLERVIQNLVSNALKFCGKNKPQVTIGTTPSEKGWATLCVRDNGVGISADELASIFEPFKRLGQLPDVQGAGLGLAICRRIIEKHRGRIWAESKEGQGTRIFVRLPNGDSRS